MPKATRQPAPTICVVLKLRPTCAQAATFRRWLWHLTGVYNWAVKTIGREADRGVYLSAFGLKARLNGHSAKMGIPSVALRGTAETAHTAWQRCFRKLGKSPRLKGNRRPLNSIAFAADVYRPCGRRITLPGIGPIRFHAQDIPDGHIGCARLVRRASGWRLCLFIKASPAAIERVSIGSAGIDPSFSSLLTLSTGEKIEHPHELASEAVRLAQAQRGRRVHLAVRLQERIATRRRDRNHKLSRSLVESFDRIAFSADRHANIARTFGKSVTSAGHSQLRSMLRYKSLTGGTEYIEVPSRNSTKTCSACGALSGPTGWRGLSVRQWICGACGAPHDRDINAAVNTLIAGFGRNHESGREAASGIAS